MSLGCPECNALTGHEEGCTHPFALPIVVYPAAERQKEEVEQRIAFYTRDAMDELTTGNIQRYEEIMRKAYLAGYLAGKESDINLYQSRFVNKVRMHGRGDFLYLASKLASEAGEVNDKICKIIRDVCISDAERTPAGLLTIFKANLKLRFGVLRELSDVLWYILMLADALWCSGSTLLEIQHQKIKGRQERGTDTGSGDDR